MHGFIAFYNGRRKEIMAGSLYGAKTAAIEYFKAPKSKAHMVSVVLTEKDVDPATGKGSQVSHSTNTI